MADWATSYPRNAKSRYLNDLTGGGGGGGLTFDPANPVFHGTNTTNAIIDTTCVGPNAAVSVSGDSAFGSQAQSQQGGTALGENAISTGVQAVAIQRSEAQGDRSLSAMPGAVAAGEESQAIGSSSQTNDFGQISHGRNAICATNSGGAIAIGDGSSVAANCGASMAIGSSCQIGEDTGISICVGPNNTTQATSTTNTIFGVGNGTNSGCRVSRILGNDNVIGSNSSDNIIVGNGNSLIDASSQNILITDGFTTGGTPTLRNTIVGLNVSTTGEDSTCIGFETSSSVNGGLALGSGAAAGSYVFQNASPITIKTDGSCFLGAGAVVANDRLVIRINSANYVIAVSKE